MYYVLITQINNAFTIINGKFINSFNRQLNKMYETVKICDGIYISAQIQSAITVGATQIVVCNTKGIKLISSWYERNKHVSQSFIKEINSDSKEKNAFGQSVEQRMHCCVPLLDLDSASQLDMNELLTFMEEGTVLVTGTEAVTIVIFYLMQRFVWSLLKTLEFVHSLSTSLTLSVTAYSFLQAFEKHILSAHSSLSYNWTAPTQAPLEALLTNTYLNSRKPRFLSHNHTYSSSLHSGSGQMSGKKMQKPNKKNEKIKKKVIFRFEQNQQQKINQKKKYLELIISFINNKKLMTNSVQVKYSQKNNLEQIQIDQIDTQSQDNDKQNKFKQFNHKKLK